MNESLDCQHNAFTHQKYSRRRHTIVFNRPTELLQYCFVSSWRFNIFDFSQCCHSNSISPMEFCVLLCTMNSFTTMNSLPTVNSMMEVFFEALISLSIKCQHRCVYPCDFSAVLSPFREFEVSLEQLGKGMLYPEFHTISCTPSCKFKQLSRNFKQFLLFQPLCYFSHFWTNFNILGIKMHVLQLRNSIVILSRTLPHSLMQFHAIFMQFHTILTISV